MICLCGQCMAEEIDKIIDSKPAMETLIERNKGDKVYSGVIMSENGLEELLGHYGNLKYKKLPKFDWENNILIFGITDKISTRIANLKHNQSKGYYLDYYDSGIKYKLKILSDGMKYSYLEIRSVAKNIVISHLFVKNFETNGLFQKY